MLPDDVLSSQVIQAAFLPPKDIRPPNYRIAYEIGGIALQDPSQGLLYQIWTAEIIGSDVVIYAEHVAQSLLFTAAGVTEISLTFDQNMNPFVAFIQDGQPKFWWFDTVVSQQIFSNLPAGSLSPRAVLDDKRPLQNGTSDIILAYVRDGYLFFRMQRDRYGIEYLLKAGIGGTVALLGMNDVWRLQFLMDIPDDHPCSFG
jgi:hypothetical protein